MRARYASIIRNIQSRIDVASRDWVEKKDDRALYEYNMLVLELTEIKEAILKSEQT